MSELNESTDKAMSHLAKIYEKYAEVGKEMSDVDKCVTTDDAAKMVTEAAEKTEVAAVKLGKAWERHRDVAEVYDTVKGEMNAALEELTTVVGATPAPACALSWGTGDCTEREGSYLNAALTILRTSAAGDKEEDALEEVAIETR